MMNNLHFHRFEDEEKLAFSLAQSIVDHLNDAIAEKGSASLIVSGGSTPKKLFNALSTMDIEWDKIKIGLCDERLVESTHPDSNEKLVRETLMTGYAAKATFVSMISDSLEVDEIDCSRRIKSSLAQSIVDHLNDALAEKGSASLIVSGGSTPQKLFNALCTMDIEWDKIKIGLCDERIVEPTHDDSNEKLVRETLMTGYAVKATFVSMIGDSLEVDEIECSQRIKSTLTPFDVLVLGMGDDAHTASLFPNNPKLCEAYDLNRENICITVEPQHAPHKRISLTLGAILSAHHVYLHFQGESKLNVYKEALSGTDTFTMPIRAIINQIDKIIEVYSA